MRHDPRSLLRVWCALLFALALAVANTSPTASASAAQGGRAADPKVRAFLRNATVRVGEPIQLFIEVEGADNAEVLDAPRAKGLVFGPLAGPARNESYVFAGGRQSRSIRLTFAAEARATVAGSYDLQQMRVRADGREFTVPEEPLSVRVVADLDATELIFFEREPLPARVYEGEPYDLDLRIGWDATLRAADLELSLPWWEQQPGVLEVGAPSGSGRGQAPIFINGRRTPVAGDVVGQVDRDGKPYNIVRLRRRYIASRAGTLRFDQAIYTFHQLLRAGNVFEPAATRQFYATLPAFVLEVRPVPEAGRPFEWTGAVGRITAERSLDRRDVDVGNSIKLQVAWSGAGNLEYFEPPDLARTPGFEAYRVLGIDDKRDPDRRRVIYDLVPLLPGDQALPAVPLWVFDTAEERFVKVETEPVPLRVRSVEGAVDPFADLGAKAAPLAPELDLADIDVVAHSGAERATAPPLATPVVALFVVLAAWPFARRAARRHGDPDSVFARRRRGARSALRRALAGAQDAGVRAAAVAAYLAARTGEPAAAWVGRDPRAWRESLARAGATDLPSDGDCLKLAALLEDLDRARFSAGHRPGASDVGADQILTVLKQLEGGRL